MCSREPARGIYCIGLHASQPGNMCFMTDLLRYVQFSSSLSPFLTGRMFVRPNILRTLRRTMIRFLIELLVRRTWWGQSKFYFILNWLVMRCKLRPELAADSQQTAWSSNRANVPRTCWAKIFGPEYSFDEYFQLGSRRKVGPIKNQLASPNTSK